MSLQDDLMAIEKKLWSGGPDAYREVLDRECLIAFSSDMAGVMSKDDIAQSAEEGRWRNVEMQPKGISELSDDAAILTYECEAERRDGGAHHALVSSGYVKRADGWKLAFHQQMPLES